MLKAIPEVLATLTLLSHIGIILFLALFIIHRFKKTKLFPVMAKFIAPRAYYFAFAVGLTAMLGSLFYSEVLKFQPCILCWYQRILMYPIPLMMYLAIVRNERVIHPYVILLSVLGAIIAIYHYFIQLYPSHSLPCTTVGGISCIKGYTFHYGYISIPLMAFTAFVLIIINMLFAYSHHKEKHA